MPALESDGSAAQLATKARLDESTVAYDAMRAAHTAAAAGGNPSVTGDESGGGTTKDHADIQQRLDAALVQTERLMTRQDDLPHRNRFRHQIYAPGFYTG